MGAEGARPPPARVQPLRRELLTTPLFSAVNEPSPTALIHSAPGDKGRGCPLLPAQRPADARPSLGAPPPGPRGSWVWAPPADQTAGGESRTLPARLAPSSARSCRAPGASLPSAWAPLSGGGAGPPEGPGRPRTVLGVLADDGSVRLDTLARSSSPRQSRRSSEKWHFERPRASACGLFPHCLPGRAIPSPLAPRPSPGFVYFTGSL